MSNYKNGKIYKIVNDIDDEIYIGSTIQPLHVRFGGHKSDIGKVNSSNISKKMTEETKKYFRIILIEDYPCDNRDQLRAREEHHRKNNDCINKQRCFLTEQEKKDQKAKCTKDWCDNNKDKRKETELKRSLTEKRIDYKKDYQKLEVVCETCGKTYRKNNKKQHTKTKFHMEHQ